MTNPGHTSGVLSIALRLGIIGLVATAVLAITWSATRERISEQHERAVLKQLNQIIPQQRYNNALHSDVILVTAEGYFPADQSLTVWRARLDGQPAGLIAEIVTHDGYNGEIRLLMGVEPSGKILGVRVVQHRETPGLGDKIELTRSDWILSFDGRTSQGHSEPAWDVRRYGGQFDQFTGATITPRAVVRAVEQGLQFIVANESALYAAPANHEASNNEEEPSG